MTLKLNSNEAKALMLASKLKPVEPYPGSGKPWKCRCKVCNSICTPRLGNVRQGRGGCIKCANKKRAEDRLLRDEVTISEMLIKGLKPLEPYKKAASKWKCECMLCHRVTYPTYWTVRNSKSKKKGCAICVGVKVDPVEVKEKMQEAGLKPFGSYPGKDKPWKSKCLTCGEVVFPNWNNIRNGAGGCGKCRYVKSGRANRTPEKDAIAFMLKAGLQPLEPYLNKEIPWKCLCLKCQKVVFPSAGNIKKGQGGCSYCRETGLNYAEAAYIYLITHEEYQSIKIGVSNRDSRPNRLKQHQKQGWIVYKIRNYKSGEQAEKVETGVLRWLQKERGLGRHLTPKQMPQGGHSETVDALEIDLPTIWAKVEQLSRLKK